MTARGQSGVRHFDIAAEYCGANGQVKPNSLSKFVLGDAGNPHIFFAVGSPSGEAARVNHFYHPLFLKWGYIVAQKNIFGKKIFYRF